MSNRPGPLAQRIAAEIRAELGRQNRSKRSLAEQIDQNHVTVSRWVNGDGPMSFDALDLICQALGITVGDLLARVESHDTVPAPRPPRSRHRNGSAAAVIDDSDIQGEAGGLTHRYGAPALAA